MNTYKKVLKKFYLKISIKMLLVKNSLEPYILRKNQWMRNYMEYLKKSAYFLDKIYVESSEDFLIES